MTKRRAVQIFIVVGVMVLTGFISNHSVYSEYLYQGTAHAKAV